MSLNISLMISGGLGFLALKKLFHSSHHITSVFTDKSSHVIIDFCNENKIPLFIGNPRKEKSKAFISKKSCDLLFSINYLFIIEQDLIAWPSKYPINIHGSLLPKYRGRTPHVWAIINGEKKAGITAHLISPEVDCGDIIHQIEIPILPNDTGNDILEKYSDQYPKIIDFVLEGVIHHNLTLRPQEHSKSTYYGKRTPLDGRILWSWHKERIRNWIRAQAKPYPGAFSYFGDHKITIHKADFSSLGFHFEQPDGYILDVQPNILTIKTPNGALDISELEYDTDNLNFKIGTILT